MLALQRACGNRAVSALMLQRQPLDITTARRVTTADGDFLRFPAGRHHTNQTDRPRFLHPRSVMITYTGAGNNGSEVIHPAVATDLDRLMTAMRAEGTRLGDESLNQAVVASAWRASEASEGAAYLRALRKTIRLHPDELPNAFPESLVELAQSELGTVGSTAHNDFRARLAAAPHWDQAQADFLISETAGFKAPRGGSTHHSGVVVDINFPYVTGRGRVAWHGMNRERNADAFRSAAGQWLNQHAPGTRLRHLRHRARDLAHGMAQLARDGGRPERTGARRGRCPGAGPGRSGGGGTIRRAPGRRHLRGHERVDAVARAPAALVVSGHARPRARSISRPRIRSPSARRPLCSYSLVTHGRAPPMSAAVSSEKTRST